jgi:hypothetical protein
VTEPEPASDRQAETVALDDESYLRWFSWAQLTLGRDLEATHAAAEVACQAQAAGEPLAEIQSAAQHAGSRPRLAPPTQIATAEWAYWGQTTLGIEPSASLRAARQAVAELESTHDLEAARKVMRASLRGETSGVAVTAIRAATVIPATTAGGAEPIPVSQPTPARSARLPLKVWLPAIAVVLVAVGIFLWAFVISPRVFPPTFSATVIGDSIAVSLDNYPTSQNVYLFVDGAVNQVAMTDSSGHAYVTLQVSPGEHRVAACMDSSGSDCPTGGGGVAVTTFSPTIKATLSNGLVSVSVDNYPAYKKVYFFVDGAADQSVLADYSGHAGAQFLLDPGKHVIKACLDSSGNDCPAGTQVTR